MKKIINIFLFILGLFLFANNHVLAYETYQSGDKIRYKNEDYYVIRPSDADTNYITVLKANALTVDEINKYGRNQSGKLFVNQYLINSDDSEKIIFDYSDSVGDVAYYNSDQCTAEYYWTGSDLRFNGTITSKCNNNYDNSDIKKVLDNWASDKIKNNDLAEIDGYKVRVLSEEDLDFLGYDYECPSDCQALSGNVLTWFKDTYRGKSFWTMYSLNDSNAKVGVIKSVNLNDTNIFEAYPVIPVVNLKKSSTGEIIDNNILKYDENKVKETNKKIYKANDKVVYKDEDYYVLKKSDGDSDYVTLVKEKPLTYDEVYKYYGYNGLEMVNDKYGAVEFLSESGSYEDSNVKQIIDKWVKDKFGKEIKSSGLLTTDDLLDYLYFDGDIRGTEGYNFISGSDTPSWVMEETYKFWMMTMFEDSKDAWYITNYHSGLNGSEAFHGKVDFVWGAGTRIFLPVYATIRPVIKVHKCALDPTDNGCLECLSKKVNYSFNRYASFKQGDTVILNGEEFYVARTSNMFMSYVRLIRKTPFTASELNRYGVDNEGNSILNNFVYVNNDINDEENIAQNQHFYKNPDDFVSNSKERTIRDPRFGFLRYQVVTTGQAYEYSDGTGGMQYYSSSECGVVGDSIKLGDGCITDYNQSFVKTVIDNWANDKLNSSDLIKINNYSSRLINYDDEAFLKKIDIIGDYKYWLQPSVDIDLGIDPTLMPKISPSGFSINRLEYCTSQYSCETIDQKVFTYKAVWPVIFVNKCVLDGGCYSEDVELNACYVEGNSNEEITIVEVENTKKNRLFSIFIGIMIIIIGFSFYIKFFHKNNKN